MSTITKWNEKNVSYKGEIHFELLPSLAFNSQMSLSDPPVVSQNVFRNYSFHSFYFQVSHRSRAFLNILKKSFRSPNVSSIQNMQLFQTDLDNSATNKNLHGQFGSLVSTYRLSVNRVHTYKSRIRKIWLSGEIH